LLDPGSEIQDLKKGSRMGKIRTYIKIFFEIYPVVGLLVMHKENQQISYNKLYLHFFWLDPGSEIQDLRKGSRMVKIRIKDIHPGSATLLKTFLYCSSNLLTLRHTLPGIPYHFRFKFRVDFPIRPPPPTLCNDWCPIVPKRRKKGNLHRNGLVVVLLIGLVGCGICTFYLNPPPPSHPTPA
jgi:hypothetical protein